MIYIAFFRKRPNEEELKADSQNRLKKYENKLKPFSGIENLTLNKGRYFKSTGLDGEKMRALITDNQGNKVIAYAWADSGAIFTKGQLVAKTTEHEIHMDHNYSAGVKISIDGDYRYHYSYQKSHVRDSISNTISAAYKRNDGTVSSFDVDLFIFEIDLFRSNTNKHHQVFFESGNYAEITNPAADDSRMNAVTNIQGELSEDEKTILLSLIIFESARIAH